jgi:hypothetical protein
MIMKTSKSLLLILAFLVLGFSSGFGQTKKALREEIAQLQAQVNQLNLDKTVLEQEKTAVVAANKSMNSENLALKSQVAGLQDDMEDCNQDYANLMADYQSLLAGGTVTTTPSTPKPPATTGGSGSSVTPSTTTGAVIGSSGGSTCASMENALLANNTYHLNYTLAPAGGWGVQIYSFSSLCQAEKKAREFAKDFTMYETYIKVKVAGGKKLFAVVYGSMPNKAQAQTYLTNFKKIAKDPAQKTAFLVQH